MKIGILSLQGCVDAHRRHLDALGVESLLVRDSEALHGLDGLIIPGGESSTMIKLLDRFEMWEDLKQWCAENPVWGVCAGSILLAQRVSNPKQKSLEIFPVDVSRNAYGRQLESFEHFSENFGQIAFIRAPRFESLLSDEVKVLDQFDGKPTCLVWKNKLICSFHPELAEEKPSPLHRAFLELCIK